jgi:copper chaperone
MTDSKQIELKVDGMTCQGCVNAVTRIIMRLDPAAEVSIDLPSGRVVATTGLTVDAIAKSVTAGGYEARAA